MASKFTTDADGNVIVRGKRYDGIAKVCQTESEARRYAASQSGPNCWAEFAVIERRSQYGRFEVVSRQK